MTDRIDKLRAALERIRDMVESNDALDPLYVVADGALDADDKARLCAPAEVAPRTVTLCSNGHHDETCCKREP